MSLAGWGVVTIGVALADAVGEAGGVFANVDVGQTRPKATKSTIKIIFRMGYIS